jgi:hypothetical protein
MAVERPEQFSTLLFAASMRVRRWRPRITMNFVTSDMRRLPSEKRAV